jgi:hypothetical protein
MGRSRILALTVLCAAMMMIILDGTIAPSPHPAPPAADIPVP